jgi:hypothetical protein
MSRIAQVASPRSLAVKPGVTRTGYGSQSSDRDIFLIEVYNDVTNVEE